MRAAAALGCLLLASPVDGGTDIHKLTAAERAAFGKEVRALLLAEPEIVQGALNPPDYGALAGRDAAAQDMTLLDRLAPEILAGADIALFVSQDCPECARAIAELATVSKTSGATFTLHDMAEAHVRLLAEELDLTDAPFYVMSDRILRGHMPQIVLEKYLKR